MLPLDAPSLPVPLRTAALGPARGGASVIGLARPQFCTTPFNRRQVCCLMWWNKGSWKESAYGERPWRYKDCVCFWRTCHAPSTNLHTGDGSKPGDWDTRWTSWRRIFDLDLNSPWSLLKQLEVKDHPFNGFLLNCIISSSQRACVKLWRTGQTPLLLLAVRIITLSF